MNKPNLPQVARSIRTSMAKHSPGILTGIGIAGMLATTVMAVKATPKASALLDEAREEKDDALTVVETVKAGWKPYIPAAVTATVSIACLIGANSVNARRNAALAAAYTLSDTALREYKDKVVETIGDKKEKSIRQEIDKDKVDNTPMTKTEVVMTQKGNTLCFDPLSSRYFKSDIEHVRRAENNLNKQMIHDIGGYVSLNEFYDEIGLPHTETGENLGWNSDNLIDLDISSHIADDGTPCIVVGHYNAPKYNYQY